MIVKLHMTTSQNNNSPKTTLSKQPKGYKTIVQQEQPSQNNPKAREEQNHEAMRGNALTKPYLLLSFMLGTVVDNFSSTMLGKHGERGFRGDLHKAYTIFFL